MGGAEHCPFVGYLFDAAEEELAKASGVLDVSEDGFDDMFAQPVATSVAALPDPCAHGLDQRPALGAAGWAATCRRQFPRTNVCLSPLDTPKRPFRFREGFRTPLGVRKSPKNEPAG